MDKQEIIEKLQKEKDECEKVARTDVPLGVIWNLWFSKADCYQYAMALINQLNVSKECTFIDIQAMDEKYGRVYECSNCHNTEFSSNFCPNCGWKIRR